jgi:integrase
MILVAFRHGFKASELVDLRWDQVDFDTATMAVRRAKRGTPFAAMNLAPFASCSASKSPNRCS